MAYASSKTCYIVAFDVSAARRPQLVERLKAYKSFCPITEHCWAILSEQSAEQVRDYLMAALDPENKIFVIRSGTGSAWRSYGVKQNEWLKRYL